VDCDSPLGFQQIPTENTCRLAEHGSTPKKQQSPSKSTGEAASNASSKKASTTVTAIVGAVASVCVLVAAVFFARRRRSLRSSLRVKRFHPPSRDDVDDVDDDEEIGVRGMRDGALDDASARDFWTIKVGVGIDDDDYGVQGNHNAHNDTNSVCSSSSSCSSNTDSNSGGGRVNTPTTVKRAHSAPSSPAVDNWVTPTAGGEGIPQVTHIASPTHVTSSADREVRGVDYDDVDVIAAVHRRDVGVVATPWGAGRRRDPPFYVRPPNSFKVKNIDSNDDI
jgi:hypothetical protein